MDEDMWTVDFSNAKDGMGGNLSLKLYPEAYSLKIKLHFLS